MGSASMIVASGGSHHPASEAGLALTWRTETLVLAPEKHPEEMRFGPERETCPQVEPTWGHATPVTEALHVSLHLERVVLCRPVTAAAGWYARRSRKPAGPIARQPRGRNGRARVDTAVRDGAARCRGNMSPRAASGGPIRSRLTPGNSAVPALRMPRSDALAFWTARALTRTLVAGAIFPDVLAASRYGSALSVNVC